jgi:multiple sugar transport system permease protein
MDGAGPWRRLVRITLPVMTRSVLTNLMLITLQTLSVFTLIFVMTSGGPNRASETLPILIYRHASHSPFLIGYGSAASLLLLAIGGVFAFVYLRLLRPEER